jgi:hypothetical protein
LRYRGWTLVDRGRFRFASKDGTKIMRRVCRENEDRNTAKMMFHAVVDGFEDGGRR